MQGIRIHSRGDSSLIYARRVYVTSHPLDSSYAIPLIIADILAVKDVQLLTPISTLSPDELDDVLSTVGLVVVPVTHRYLSEPSYARDVEVAGAILRGIPILPIILEGGLVDSFNDRYGNRQFLDRTDTDPTSIGYHQKLKNFFEGFVISDISVNLVKKEFDATVFLSYRKKDRAYARRLMSLIHDQPSLRDVAIWYDEYLTPGERFDDEIKSAIESCDAFVMAVTQNLVGEDNYVNEHEFPLACEKGKSIIPVKCADYDSEHLDTRYPSIPSPISSDDADSLAAALTDALADRLRTENDHDPRHIYLIGLAYLRGIGVEVDYRRAFSLISEAAATDYLPALRRLAIMYSLGEGVEYSYERAFNIRRKIMLLHEAGFDKNNIKEQDFEYFDVLSVMCRMILSRRADPKYRSLFDRMLWVAALLYDEFCNDEASIAWSTANKEYGDFLVAIGEPIAAEAYYRTCLEVLDYMADFECDEEIQELYMETSVALSKSLGERADYSGALAVIKKVTGLLDEIDEEFITNHLLVAKVYHALATCYEDVKDRHNSIINLERARDLINLVRENGSEMTAVHEKIYILFALAKAYSAVRRKADADSALAIATELIDRLGDSLHSSWKYNLELVKAEIMIIRRSLPAARRQLDKTCSEIRSTYGDGENYGLISYANQLYSMVHALSFRLSRADEYTAHVLREKSEKAISQKTTSAYLDLAGFLGNTSRLFFGRRKSEWLGYERLARKRELVLCPGGDDLGISLLGISLKEKRQLFFKMLIFILALVIPASVIAFIQGVKGIEILFGLFVAPLVLTLIYYRLERIFSESGEGGFDHLRAIPRIHKLNNRVNLFLTVFLLLLLLGMIALTRFELVISALGSDTSTVISRIITVIAGQIVPLQFFIIYESDNALSELMKYAANLSSLDNYVPPRRDKDFWE